MSDSESEDVVARSRRLREAATPGPWHVGQVPGDPLFSVIGDYQTVGTAQLRPDAALIAATPTLLAELEAEVERLRTKVVFWETLVKEVLKSADVETEVKA